MKRHTGANKGVDKRAQKPCRTPRNYPRPWRGEGAAGIWFSKVLCAWSHRDISKWLYEQALEGDQTWLGSVTGLSTGLLASARSSHLTVTSKWDRERKNRDREKTSHPQVNGSREQMLGWVFT